ncbi:hypothetical protein LVY72_05700 [Arthrobacter sp. I2-34]|uniref:Maltokinase N-terminal cap domain-containing protein n=1 Tax=Arthrobacter hankyongi TaxID=2904801 RepID=A0ABS9L3Y7_9MICC|nr:hypothetical protein [Arthrobacter hankyongi]MCG2621409.1 hypothetical protein [Arthrobacter hankyongi]
MAILYRAELRPTKQELLETWVPQQGWYIGSGTTLEHVGAYRFDDPAGEVGLETHLVRFGAGPVMQVPLSYRGAPLHDADQWLVCTMEHSVLGDRWVYDACADPVYAAALASTILTGAEAAEQFVDKDGQLEPLETFVHVRGSGTSGTPVTSTGTARPASSGPVTTIDTDGPALTVVRVLGQAKDPGGPHQLRGTWLGQDEPELLAFL